MDAAIVEKLVAGVKAAAAVRDAIVWLGVEEHGIEARASRRGETQFYVQIHLVRWQELVDGDRVIEKVIPYVVDALDRHYAGIEAARGK